MDHDDPQDVVLAVGDGAVLLDASGPLEVFTLAARLGAGYRVRLASPYGLDVRTREGVRLGVDTALEDIDGTVHILLVAGCDPDPGGEPLRLLSGLVRSLGRQSQTVASVCIGAFALAEAGLLDRRQATTHWAFCEALHARYPSITVRSDAIFVRDGDVITAAGVTAGIDLALALVERDHGAGIARQVARWLVVFLQRPGGQSQFSVRDRARSSRHPAIRVALDAVAAQPAADHSLAALAGRAQVSPRHLSRLFITVLGITPGQYVEQVRVEAARHLLEAGDDPMESVARRCGFGSTETMRRGFHRVLGVSPADYRQRFQTSHHLLSGRKVDV